MYDIEEKNVIFSQAGCDSKLSGSSPAGWPARSVSLTAGRAGTQTEKSGTVSKVYKRTTRFNYSGMAKKDIFCFDDSSAYGEYFSLNLEVWEEVPFSIDEHNRINIGRKNAGKEVRFFAHITEGGKIKKSDNLISFPRENYAEIRRVRGENIGLPLTVNTNGTVWTGNRFINMDLKIFIRRG